MEKLTNSIADKISFELQLDKDNREIVAYGLFAMMQIVLSISLVVIFGLIFHVMVEAVIISLVGSVLRKYSGGAHASTPGKCAFIGTVICVGQALLLLLVICPVMNEIFLICLGIVIFIWSYYLICELAPVDSPAKPIRNIEKRIRMKKGSVLVLCFYLLITVINIMAYFYIRDKNFLVYTLCIYGGTSWQVFTLTKVGHSAINRIDLFLNQILKIIKGREVQ